MTAPLEVAPRRVRRVPWEQGSDFHLSLESGTALLPWASGPHALWGSGRDALRALLAWGRDTRGWRRLLVPSYFCQHTLAAVAAEIELGVYPSGPLQPRPTPLAGRPGDVVLVVRTFGLGPSAEVTGGAVVVEDHSHDPTSPRAARSRADYAVASLRKTLPLPDGGVLWSPAGRALPPEIPMSRAHAGAVALRLSAMTLKRRYLVGEAIDKAEYRDLAVRAEREIAAGRISGISGFSRSRLPSLPTAAWRAARARNLQAFRDALGRPRGATLLPAPFAATLVFADPGRRDAVREALRVAGIYASVLWRLDAPVIEAIPPAHVSLSQRILSIHCDHRYGPGDLARVADRVNEALRWA